jgi:antitoxin component YwqK of YwqJK toxin-antitoxin module
MRYFYSVLLLLSSSIIASAQTKKAYISADGNAVADPQKATSYVLVKKINDSVYLAQVYDMQSHLLVKGTYKDELMNQPNGKFFYYHKKLVLINDNNGLKIDTTTYLERTGYFVNGTKNGTWVEYKDNGQKDRLYAFVNNKLNGPFRAYNPLIEIVSQEGNFIDDVKEGEWNTYNYGIESPAVTEVYLHGKIVKKDTHLISAQPAYALDGYIKNAVKLPIDSIKNLLITLSITAEGKIDTVNIDKPLSTEMKKALVTVFLKAPKFKPAVFDNKPIRQPYIYTFNIYKRPDNGQDELGPPVITRKLEIGKTADPDPYSNVGRNVKFVIGTH